jgi:dGTPase
MTFVATWEKLICAERVPKSETEMKERPTPLMDDRSPFEADYDRVIFSDPFRRLAKKTQVHPLAPNDHVHNRLTHSIEVASVGRSFGKLLANMPCVKKELNGKENNLPLILQVACLIHDIGNPPFGHAGEYAIREWATSNESRIFPPSSNEKLKISDAIKSDIKKFDGNAQGFRLASRWDNPRCGYMRLTYASLGSMVKYPWPSSDNRALPKGKFNYMNSEHAIFKSIWEKLGLILPNEKFARHPLSFLVEAADDICYRILDMEDAVSMKICDATKVGQLFSKIAKLDYNQARPISETRGAAMRILINEIWGIFDSEYNSIMSGTRNDPLTQGLIESSKSGLNDVKDLYEVIFAQRNKVAFELGAYKVIGRIINALCNSIHELCEAEDFDQIKFVHKRCIDLAWGSTYAKENCQKGYEWWIGQIFDFVSGLTDNYAIKISNEIDVGFPG